VKRFKCVEPALSTQLNSPIAFVNPTAMKLLQDQPCGRIIKCLNESHIFFLLFGSRACARQDNLFDCFFSSLFHCFRCFIFDQVYLSMKKRRSCPQRKSNRSADFISDLPRCNRHRPNNSEFLFLVYITHRYKPLSMCLRYIS